MTPIKDQGDTNLCWAYAAINASEASILKNNIGLKDSLRLNPKALAYRKYVRSEDPLLNVSRYYNKFASEWTSRPGQIGQTPAILSMWQGPIGSDKPSADVWENSLYRLENANLISSGVSDDSEERITEIKNAIAKYGAVTASCYYDGGTKLYYNDKSVKNGIPHAITLVGWDDSIDKTKFDGNVGRNGGWLVKNSYNDNGYFWLTYESKIAKTTAWTFTYAPRDAYDFNYYYDNSEDDFGLLKSKRYANVYEAKKGTNEKAEYIEAVNVGFYGNDVEVKIKVYTNLRSAGAASVESGTLQAEKTQTFKYGGFNTVKLDTPIKVEKGSYFSIVTEVSNPNGDAYVSVAQSESKKSSYTKTYDEYGYILNGGYVAGIKAYTKLKTDNACDLHEYGDLVPKQEPTCTQTGMGAHYKCSVCNKYFDESKTEKTVAELTIPINPNAHDFGAWIEEVPATCVATGTKGHKYCNRCNRHYDESGNEITDLTIPTNDNHDWNAWASNGNGTHTRTCKRDSGHKENGTCSGGTATCENKAVCSVCGVAYGDKLGHDYGEVKYTWTSDNTCKAERVCKHDNAHIESETVTATGTTITAATCKEKGKMKYTATFANTAFSMQEKEVDIDFAPHTFGVWKDEIPAMTENFGTKGHKDCTVCGRHFDKDGNEITDLRIAKIGTHKVTVTGGTVSGGKEFVKAGEKITITADAPSAGKAFKGWKDESGKIVSTDKNYTFVVNAEINLTAVYDNAATDGSGKGGGTLSGGKIAGIVVGVLAAVGAVTAAVVIVIKKKRK
ncbi:MAG: lectin like domain-containing protein [Eubacteriales bacterium]|nr:lectin like domain-containing protein [Eubacteriales bacterium]